MHRRGSNPRRVVSQARCALVEGWNWLNGSSSPHAKHARNAEQRRAQVRKGIAIFGVLGAAAILGSSTLPATHHLIATKTYKASAWPGLTYTGSSPQVASQTSATTTSPCSIGSGDSSTPAASAAAAPTSSSPAATTSGSGASSVPAKSSSSSSASNGSKSASKATTSSYSAPARSGSSPAATGATATGASPSAKVVLVGATSGGSSASSTSTSTTTTTIPGTSTLQKVPGAGTVGSIANAATNAAGSVEQVLQTFLGGSGVTSASRPGSSSQLEPLPPISQSSGSDGSTGSSGDTGSSAQTTPATATGSAPSLSFGQAFGGTDENIGCNLVGLGQVGALAPGETQVQAAAVNAALGLLGTPYVWGGESKRGFDCSGLVQFVFDTAGVHLPRVAQDQYDAGPAVPPGSPVVPGDLVFFGSSPQSVVHVGMFVGDGLMINAPYTGAVVRFDRVAGSLPIVGVTSPGGQQIA